MPYSARIPSGGSVASRPIGEINTTPLIDVLLVLIVMLIIVVPVATHSLEVPLPTGEPTLAIEDSNTVHIDSRDRLYWNDHAVDRQVLLNQLAGAARLPDPPTIRFDPAPNAGYDRAAKTIALIKDAGTDRFAFIGNERHRNFGRAD